MQLLENILGAKNNLRVLRHLVKHKNWEFNISELSKDTGINKGAVSRIISKLEAENIISVKRKGKIKLFSISQSNVFIKQVIIPLFEKEDSFFDRLLDRVVNALRTNAVSVILYGSVASGKATLKSDIDVLLIVKQKNKAIDKKSKAIKEEFLKNDLILTIDIMAINEFKRSYRIKEPLMKSILNNHRILYGRQIQEVMR